MVTNQAYLFLIFIITGIIIGLLFDFFRIYRKIVKTSDFVTYLQDMMFWILSGMIVLYAVFIFNNGELRLFMFLGILLGTIIYMIFISTYIIKINVKIINMIIKFLKIIIIPFNFIYGIIHKIIFKPITFLFINVNKSFNNFLKKAQKIKNIVKNWK